MKTQNDEQKIEKSVTSGVNIDEDICTTSRKKFKPIYYLSTYCLLYFVLGMVFSASVCVITYLQNHLKIDLSQASLIYSICYIATIIGSVVAGQIVSSSKFSNTHYYITFITVISCILLFLIEYITIYALMIIIWIVIGVWIGTLYPMPVIYICNIYQSESAISLSKMLLSMTIGQAFFSAIYDDSYINYLWYIIIFLSIIFVVIITFILPTPTSTDTDNNTLSDNSNNRDQNSDININNIGNGGAVTGATPQTATVRIKRVKLSPTQEFEKSFVFAAIVTHNESYIHRYQSIHQVGDQRKSNSQRNVFRATRIANNNSKRLHRARSVPVDSVNM